MGEEKSLKILWVSDNPSLATGFGRVTREVVSRLACLPGVELAVKGWGRVDPTVSAGTWPFLVYPSVPEYYGQNSFDEVVRTFKPNVVITLGEIRTIHWIRIGWSMAPGCIGT